MKQLKYLLLYIFIIFFTGCGEDLKNSLLPHEEIKFSKEYIELFRNKDFESLYKPLNQNLKNDKNTKQLFGKISQFIPSEKPEKIDLVGSSTFVTNADNAKTWKANITFQHTYTDSWLLININLERVNDGDIIVNSFKVQPLKDSMENMNKFTLNNKTVLHYLILISAIIVPIFIIFTFIIFIRTKIEKRKWLWGIFILLGFVKFTINWTSGTLGIYPLTFGLLGSGYFYNSEFAPVFIFIWIPIGAILFWLKKYKDNKASEINS